MLRESTQAQTVVHGSRYCKWLKMPPAKAIGSPEADEGMSKTDQRGYGYRQDSKSVQKMAFTKRSKGNTGPASLIVVPVTFSLQDQVMCFDAQRSSTSTTGATPLLWRRRQRSAIPPVAWAWGPATATFLSYFPYLRRSLCFRRVCAVLRPGYDAHIWKPPGHELAVGEAWPDV